MRGYPHRYLVFDTESESRPVAGVVPTEELTLRLGVVLICDPVGRGPGREVYAAFRTSQEFHDLVMGLPYSQEPIYVFAHNIGFDVRQVEWFRWVGQGRYTLTPPAGMPGAHRFKAPLFVGESPPFILRLFRQDGQQLLLLDSFQWFPHRLSTLGEWVNEPKWEHPEWEAPDDEWFAYCEQDVRVLHAALRRLWGHLRGHRIPDFAMTPATCSRQVYRMRYEKRRIVVPEDPAVFALDRHAYYGGLAEALVVGTREGPIYQLDVASLYPAVMERHRFPCEVVAQGDYSGESSIPEGFAPWEMTAEVWLETEHIPFPVRGDDVTLWVTGRVRTILAGPELVRAYSLGVLVRVGRWVRYRLDDLFSGFVRDFWESRAKAIELGDRVANHVCKVLMNSLHGKFGQKTGEWLPVGHTGKRSQFASGTYLGPTRAEDKDFRIMGGQEMIRARDEEDDRGFVPIAAWTASYARCLMWDMIYLAGPENVFHIATDSVLTNALGHERLVDAGMVQTGSLGYFREEGVYEQCRIYGVHALDLGGKKQRSGIKNGSIEIAPEIWSVERWSSLMADLCRGRVSSVSIETLLMHGLRNCSRREVLEGGLTRPWSIDNWDVPPERQLDMPVRRRKGRKVTNPRLPQ